LEFKLGCGHLGSGSLPATAGQVKHISPDLYGILGDLAWLHDVCAHAPPQVLLAGSSSLRRSKPNRPKNGRNACRSTEGSARPLKR